MSVLISGATIIDGAAEHPIEGKAIWVEGKRIKAIARPDELRVPSGVTLVDARGKFVIPGLLNANVHLLVDVSLENLSRHWGHYEDLIIEAAQVALKNGLTTVFDTWGPRRFLMSVRDQIDRGEIVGSRIFCAGNIVGFDGPLSADFSAKAAEVATSSFRERINAIWVENVGRHLMWLSPPAVASEVRAYICRGIDFLKYASNEHYGGSVGALLAFSPHAQAAIVEEAHRANITAQAHTMSVEGLRLALEAGCDLIQHANITGPVEIPEATLELIVERKTGAVVFPWTNRGFEWLMEHLPEDGRTNWRASDANARNLIRAGATILLANDGSIVMPERRVDPKWSECWGGAPEEDSLYPLATGHFVWLRAMEEKGCRPMDLLKAATHNIATAYGKDKDLGTLEVGKIADMIVLDKNPLESAENYRSIHAVIKEGLAIDRGELPEKPILTGPMEAAAEETRSYIPFHRPKRVLAFPMRCCH